MSGGNDVEYAVDYSQALREEITQLQLRAAHVGKYDDVVDALRVIDNQLRTAPLEFGEPLYDLHHPEAKVRVATVVLLGVRFAVYEDHRRVWALCVVPLSGHGI